MTEPTEPRTNWRPWGQHHELPSDTADIWKRLTALTVQTWLAAAEQVEQRALIEWLNPSSSSAISDQGVFDLACEITGVGKDSAEDFLQPVYVVAETAWQIIHYIAEGGEISLERERLHGESDSQWQERRGEQALDWWATVMRELDRLLVIGVISASELSERTTAQEYVLAMRSRFIRPIFDGPLAIGASLYIEPSPGTGLGFDEGVLYIMEALAFAVHRSVEAWKGLTGAEVTDEQRKTAVLRIDFFSSLLKGYAWAAAHYDMGVSLPGQLIKRPDVWESAKAALVAGRAAANSTSVDEVRSAGFRFPMHERFQVLSTITVDSIIAQMDDRIVEWRRDQEAFRDFRRLSG